MFARLSTLSGIGETECRTYKQTIVYLTNEFRSDAKAHLAVETPWYNSDGNLLSLTFYTVFNHVACPDTILCTLILVSKLSMEKA